MKEGEINLNISDSTTTARTIVIFTVGYLLQLLF